MPDLHKAWALFMSDPVNFIAMFGVAIVVVAGFVWWLRGHIAKERIAAKDAQIDLARSQLEDLTTKLAEAGTTITNLQEQVDARAPTAELSANVASTSALIGDMQIVANSMGVTMGPTSGAYKVVVPKGRIDEQ